MEWSLPHAGQIYSYNEYAKLNASLSILNDLLDE